MLCACQYSRNNTVLLKRHKTDGSLRLMKETERNQCVKLSDSFLILTLYSCASSEKQVHLLLSGTIRGNFFTTAVSSCIMVSTCSVLRRRNHSYQIQRTFDVYIYIYTLCDCSWSLSLLDEVMRWVFCSLLLFDGGSCRGDVDRRSGGRSSHRGWWSSCDSCAGTWLCLHCGRETEKKNQVLEKVCLIKWTYVFETGSETRMARWDESVGDLDGIRTDLVSASSIFRLCRFRFI